MSTADTLPPSYRVPRGVTEDAQFAEKYELEHELGKGGSGVVFCVRHRGLDQRRAIKFLTADPENVEAIARFRREARAASRVRSEHVVRIFDVATTQAGVPYVVMEYLEGADLERMLLESAGAPLPIQDVIEFVLQACEALAACHAVDIVHRDLKPSNLFWTDGGDGLPLIKVLDFGISKLGSVPTGEPLTGQHVLMGSPPYMSPEQFATPTDVDVRADIWALGVILYELVTGERPFGGDTIFQTWESVKSTVPVAIEQRRRDAPRALGPVVFRCLEKDRAKRYQTVAELAKGLLPHAPERCRSTVARIVRIIEASGATTESLPLPASQRLSTGGATSVSIGASRMRSRSLMPLVWLLGVTAALIGFFLVLHGDISRGSVGSGAESSAPGTAAAPKDSNRGALIAPSSPNLLENAHGQQQAAPLPTPRAGDAPVAAPPSPPVRRQAGARAEVTHGQSEGEHEGKRVAPPPSAALSASGADETPSPPKRTPFIVDIMEQRKEKTGGQP